MTTPTQTVKVISTLPDLERLCRFYSSPSRRSLPLAFDTETTGLNPRLDKLVAMQFKQGETPAVIVDCRRLTMTGMASALSSVLTACNLLGANLKFDLGFLLARGMRPTQRAFDTQIAEQVIYGLGMSDGRAQGVGFSLKDVVARRCGVEMSKEERSWFIGLHERPDEWNAPFPAEQVAYMAEDVNYLAEIHAQQADELAAGDLEDVFAIEMRALPALAHMELAGIHIDVAGWQAFIEEKRAEALTLQDELLLTLGPVLLELRWRKYDAERDEYASYLQAQEEALAWCRTAFDSEQPLDETWGQYKIRGMQAWRAQNAAIARSRPRIDTDLVNLDSSQQVLAALQELGIKLDSTRREYLEEYEGEWPVVDTLLKYRKTAKFITSFGDSLLAKVEEDGRIHPDYVQIGASTGRMSCTNPNWQQVPSKGDGVRLRKLVQAAPGNVLITADFSNIELRILAELSRDKNMLRFFNAGRDLHGATACLMFGLPEDTPAETLKDKQAGPVPGWSYRDVAKTINFGLVYGMSATKLGRTLRVPKDEAQALMNKYFGLYQGVKAWLDDTAQRGLAAGAVRTMANRLRRLPLEREPGHSQYADSALYREAHKEWRGKRAMRERQSKNTPIQGTSADITKLALGLWVETAPPGAQLVAVVHDEVVVEVKAEDAEWTQGFLERAMFDAARAYLTHVAFPMPEAVISESWEH